MATIAASPPLFATPSSPPSPRVPPHDPAAEQALLGAMLLAGDAAAATLEVTGAADFYWPAHAHVFAAIEALYAAGEPVDTVTVAAELHRTNLLDAVGGAGALVELQASTPVAGNADHYGRIVASHARRRALQRVAGEIAELAYGVGDIDALEDQAQALAFAATARRTSRSPATLGEVLDDGYEHAVALSEADGLVGVTTGYSDLDGVLLGLQPATLTILGARPGMGKTSLALGIALAAAHQERRPVLFFSLEMSQRELSQRVYAADGRIPAKAIRTGCLNEAQWETVDAIRAGLRGEPLTIDDDPDVGVLDIRTRARRLAAASGDGLALIVVDYLQLLASQRGAESRQVGVAEMSRGLRVLARELDCPVLALSQLSRSPEARADKRPILADLRESGVIEQDADVVMFLYRDEEYDANTAEPGVAEVHVAKHRSGRTGTVKLAWQPQFARVVSLDRMHPARTEAERYTAWHGEIASPITQLSSGELIQILVEIIEVEGPIIAERAYRLANEATGSQHLGRSIRSTLSRAVTSAVRQEIVLQADPLARGGNLHTTLRMPHQPVVRTRARGPRSSLEHIPPEELRVALHSGMRQELPTDERYRTVLEQYEFSQLAKAVRAHLLRCEQLPDPTDG